MKKLISIFTVLLLVTPAIADPNTNVATTSYVQGAFNALDAAKQDTIDSTHKLSADLVDDSTTTNKFVTAAEKSQITTNQNAITTLNANDQTAGSVDYKIAQATSGMVTASSTTTFTNKTIDATGTGNSITNLGTSNFASGTVVDSTTGIAAAATASDSKLVTEKAVRSAVDTAITAATYDDTVLAGRVTSLESTVGDNTAGLVKDVADNTAAIAGKQAQLTNGTNDVSATVATSVRAAGTANDTTLVTESAVRNAVNTAGTVTDSGNGAIQSVTGSGSGITVTRGDAQIVVKSNGNYSSTATMWIE